MGLDVVEHAFDVEGGVDFAQIGLEHAEGVAPPGVRQAVGVRAESGRWFGEA